MLTLRLLSSVAVTLWKVSTGWSSFPFTSPAKSIRCPVASPIESSALSLAPMMNPRPLSVICLSSSAFDPISVVQRTRGRRKTRNRGEWNILIEVMSQWRCNSFIQRDGTYGMREKSDDNDVRRAWWIPACLSDDEWHSDGRVQKDGSAREKALLRRSTMTSSFYFVLFALLTFALVQCSDDSSEWDKAREKADAGLVSSHFRYKSWARDFDYRPTGELLAILNKRLSSGRNGTVRKRWHEGNCEKAEEGKANQLNGLQRICSELGPQ